MTLHIVRPDGIEVETKRAMPILSSAGGGTLDIPMADNAFSGTWRLWASAGSTAQVGETSVSVQDFVPPRLEAKVTLPPGPLAADGAIQAQVAADYFYGSPGADLTGTVDGTLQAAAAPFKGLDGFQFGLAQEPFLPKALAAQDFQTDDKGLATVVLKADEVPDTSVPLELALHATVNDVDGRPAIAETTKVLHTADRFIGLHQTNENLADGATATFDVALVDGDGKPLPPETLKWDLVKEDYTYNYFYKRRPMAVERDDHRLPRSMAAIVALDAPTDAEPSQRTGDQAGAGGSRPMTASGKTATSLRFGAGWWATRASADSANRKPEVMAVTVDANAPAGKVRAMVEPSFAGRVLVMLDGATACMASEEKEMPKGGGAVEFDAADVPPSRRLCACCRGLAGRRRVAAPARPRRWPCLGARRNGGPQARCRR